MKSSQHAHGKGWEGNGSRETCCVLRKFTEKADSKTQNRNQVFWLGFCNKKTVSFLIGIPHLGIMQK